MPGSSSYTSQSLPLAALANPLVVSKYNRTSSPGQRIGAAIPNIECLSIQNFDGPHPPRAHFKYILDDSDPSSPYPNQIEQVWPINASNPYLLTVDTEIVVTTYLSDGTPRILFDGFVSTPQADISPGGQQVTFVAVGVAIRCWDSPIQGRLQRDSSDPLAGKVIQTAIPVRFNPASTSVGGPQTRDWQPNCTPDGYDVNEGQGNAYPVFLDEALDVDPGEIGLSLDSTQDYWTLGRFARYILFNYNDQKYVSNPDFTVLDALLESLTPTNGQFYNPNDSSTYTAKPVQIRDFAAENMKWPDALAVQLAYGNFDFRFACDTDENGEPNNYLEVYRKDAQSAIQPKQVSLPPTGTVLDPGSCNVQSLHLTRDMTSLANRFDIEAALDQYEVSVILWPSFQPTAGDYIESAKEQFFAANLDSTTDPHIINKYRLYIADESGFGAMGDNAGHWDLRSSSWKTDPFDFSGVFGSPPNGDTTPLYVRRFRPGRHTLISRDNAGRARRARLDFSRNYAGALGVFWDGTGDWQPIDGGWTLLRDRLGIYVNIEDPDKWNVGKYKGSSPQNPDAILHGIESLSDPASPTALNQGSQLFVLRLTTVIEADQMLNALADKRAASPTQFAVSQRIPASDHCHRLLIAPNTPYNTRGVMISGANPDNSGTDSATKQHLDDTPAALTHTQLLRAAHEFPPLSGTITIPWLSLAYQIGDRISQVNGRNVSLQVNVGTTQGEAPAYPFVVAVNYDFDGHQLTTLQLSDRRAEPQRV